MQDKIFSALLGVAVGDALGVPYEFLSRKVMDKNPAKGMVGQGTHSQKIGTWSDDAALMFCLAESLCTDYDLKDISKKLIAWKTKAYWSARGEVFDIGITTSRAISNLERIHQTKDWEQLLQQRYLGNEMDNGNGALMRILPLLFYIKDLPLKEQFEITWDVSALTHRHIRSAVACQFYLIIAANILKGQDKEEAYLQARITMAEFWTIPTQGSEEQQHFQRMIQQDIRELKRTDIQGSGYVIESLEASLWCFLTTNDYERATLAAVNLGRDTDTTAAITGGLAGLYYGAENIPLYWRMSTARYEDIADISRRLALRINEL